MSKCHYNLIKAHFYYWVLATWLHSFYSHEMTSSKMYVWHYSTSTIDCHPWRERLPPGGQWTTCRLSGGHLSLTRFFFVALMQERLFGVQFCARLLDGDREPFEKSCKVRFPLPANMFTRGPARFVLSFHRAPTWVQSSIQGPYE